MSKKLVKECEFVTEINYVKASVTATVREIVERIDNGTMVFDNVSQRGSVWNKQKQSCLIRSILLRFPVDAVLARQVSRDGIEIMDVIDGQQRSLAVYEFIKGIYTLDCGDFNTHIKIGNVDDDIAGKQFSELPHSFQEKILNFTYDIDYYTGLGDKTANEMFYFRNNGQAMASDQHMWAVVEAKAPIESVGRGHELFKAILSEKAQKNYGYRSYLLQAHALLKNPKGCGLEKKSMMTSYMDCVITDEDVAIMKQICDKYLAVFNLIEERCPGNKTYKGKIKTALKKKTHFTSLFPVFAKAINEGRTDEELTDWVLNFFGGKYTTISSIYNTASATSVLKESNVQVRISELNKYYNKFFEDKPVVTKNEEKSSKKRGRKSKKNETVYVEPPVKEENSPELVKETENPSEENIDSTTVGVEDEMKLDPVSEETAEISIDELTPDTPTEEVTGSTLVEENTDQATVEENTEPVTEEVQ